MTAGDQVSAQGGVGIALYDRALKVTYDPPTRHFKIGSRGPTGQVLEGGRPSRLLIPVGTVPKYRGRGGAQQTDQQPECRRGSQ